MSDDNILQDLNPAQRDAVIHRNGPMLVVAGAGSAVAGVVGGAAQVARGVKSEIQGRTKHTRYYHVWIVVNIT